MNERPPFLDGLGSSLVAGGVRYRRRRGRRVAAMVGATMAVFAVAAVAVARLDDGQRETVTAPPPPTSPPVAPDAPPIDSVAPPVSGPELTSPPLSITSAPCGADEPATASAQEDAHLLLDAFNRWDAAGIIDVLGDGPVLDQSVDRHEFDSIADWITNEVVAARVQGLVPLQGAVLVTAGTTTFTAAVRNEELDSAGTQLRVEIRLHREPCPWKVEIGSGVVESTLCDRCSRVLGARAGHVAIWTGTETWVVGGTRGIFATRPAVSIGPDGLVRPLPDLPSALQEEGLAAVWTGSSAVVVGRGHESGTIALYELSPGSVAWREMTTPEPRGGVGAAVWTGTDVVLVGGDIHAPESSVLAYRPGDATWRRLPDYPGGPLARARAVWTGSSVIVVGGYAGTTAPTVWSLDISTQSWTRLPDPPDSIVSLDYHDVEWTGSEVLVVGAFEAGPTREEADYTARVHAYNPATLTWRTAPMAPQPWGYQGTATWTGEELLIIGGEDLDGVTLDRVLAFDPATQTWAESTSIPVALCAHTATLTPTNLVVVGGSDVCTLHSVPSAEVWSLDLDSRRWTSIATRE